MLPVNGLPSLLMFVGLLLMVASLLYRTQKRLGRNRRRSSKALEFPSGTGNVSAQLPLRDTHREEVELYDLAREVTAQIDSKMSALRHLIRLANQEAVRLETAIEEAQRLGVFDEEEGTRPEKPSATDSAPAAADLTEVVEELDEEEPPSLARLDVPRRRRDNASHLAGPGGTAERYEQIRALSDAGLDAAAISREVGRPLGEVELVLSLRGR